MLNEGGPSGSEHKSVCITLSCFNLGCASQEALHQPTYIVEQVGGFLLERGPRYLTNKSRLKHSLCSFLTSLTIPL